MRIGTWNLEGKWGPAQADLLAALACDVLLLTEVRADVRHEGMSRHATAHRMRPGRAWSAILSSGALHPLPDPHDASALAEVGGTRVCSSILPWRTSGDAGPWTGADTTERTINALPGIEAARPTVWGGDWNNALTGPDDRAGSTGARQAIADAVRRLGLQVPTTDSPHRLGTIHSIDHIAVPAAWTVHAVEHHVAATNGTRFSDHDAYVVDVTPPLPPGPHDA